MEVILHKRDGVFTIEENISGKLKLKNESLNANSWKNFSINVLGKICSNDPSILKEKYSFFTDIIYKTSKYYSFDSQTESVCFSVPLESSSSVPILPSYEGFNFGICYDLVISYEKSLLSKEMKYVIPFIVKDEFLLASQYQNYSQSLEISLSESDIISPTNNLSNIIGKFSLTYKYNSSMIPKEGVFEGNFKILQNDLRIESIELNLIKIEHIDNSVIGQKKTTKDCIQIYQIADGNVLPNLEIPFYMNLPRITCISTCKNAYFSLDYEMVFFVKLKCGRWIQSVNTLILC